MVKIIASIAGAFAFSMAVGFVLGKLTTKHQTELPAEDASVEDGETVAPVKEHCDGNCENCVTQPKA